MEREGIWIDSRQDKTLQPKTYFTSEMWARLREAKTLHIQRMVRGWFARRVADALLKERNLLRIEQAKREEEFRQKEEEKHKKEIERRIHPKNPKDFEILYKELEVRKK